MSAPVDVLAVMAHATATFKGLNKNARCSQDYVLDIEDSEAARAAVAELIETAIQIRTTLSLTRSNVMTEIKRGAQQWVGVPELLQDRIETFDAALARVKGGAA